MCKGEGTRINGMDELLRLNNTLDSPPVPYLREDEVVRDDQDDDADNCVSEITPEVLQECTSVQDEVEISSSISSLTSAGIIDDNLRVHLTNVQKEIMHNSPCPDVSPSFTLNANTPEIRSKHCPYVEIQRDGKSYFINKTTAVWLFSEGERVSSDRLFRVRAKQPYSNASKGILPPVPQASVCVREHVSVGDLCVFLVHAGSSNEWTIGKVLQFSYYQEKTKKSQQYHGLICLKLKGLEFFVLDMLLPQSPGSSH